MITEKQVMIDVADVSVQYGPHMVLSSIALKVSEGDRLCIIGPSGGGKSTLIKVCSRLLKPNSGIVRFERPFGFVLQEGGLFSHLSARENICLPGILSAIPGDQIQTRLKELCESVQLETHLLELKPNNLSGGQRQRVALMRALFLDPPVLFMDEAFSALDPVLKMSILKEFRNLLDRLGKTLLFVSHDLKEAAELATRVLFLNRGQIGYLGDIERFLMEYQKDDIEEWKNAFVIDRGRP